MSKFYKYIIVLFCFLMNFSGYSQQKIKHFSSDSSEFFRQMEQFLTSSRQQDGKLLMDEFSWDWFGGKFSEKQKQGVYKVTNLMLKKRKKAFPDFKNYLVTVSQFVNSKYQTKKSFENWQEILIKLIKGKNKKRFGSYLKSCNHLFAENLLYKSPSNTWSANNSNYVFGYDSLPNISFEALTLTCYSKGDSSVIKDTKGVYYPTESMWVGEGGKVTWERAGFSPEIVYAEINHYTINLKSPKYQIRDVTFYDYTYFNEPMKGVLKDKVLANVKKVKATYPRFESYNTRFKIPNIAEGVDYVGGFSLYGRKVLGTGSKEEDAYLIFNKKGVPFLKVASKIFSIKLERIVSKIASVTFYIDKDSIYHPGVDFKFLINERDVSLVRDNKGIKITPYFNSYHQVDMDFESLNWKIDSPMIEFRNIQGGTKTDAKFMSSNFFKQNDYIQLMGLQSKHPLYTIKKLADKLDTNYITNRNLAEYTLQSMSSIESMLLDLSNLGFIKYNYEEKSFIVKEKLMNWVSASGGNVDYDVIVFRSDVKGYSNATLSLLNYDLQLRGINSINVSDSQEVKIYPFREKVTLKKNRDFDFNGVIQAGRFDIMGSNFSFKYDEFKVDMPNVDSLRIYAETEGNGNRKPKIRPVKTVIEKINGSLLIDKPDNKSGVKKSDEYPILNSYKDSYVFYERESIQGGVYSKNDFYFHVDPFTIDSLDNFDNSQLQFKGTMLSAGIFGSFEETLRLQPDHSLGFVRTTPAGGQKMYEGKGTFNDTIRLSHNGLRGSGKLEYIKSTTHSNDFVFFPDSMNAIAQNYSVEENPVAIEFPAVEGENVTTKWLPKEDYMTHSMIDKPIAMYDMKSYLNGGTTIQPDGLTGFGTFEFEKAEMDANLIKFKFKDFQADTADFRLKDVGNDDADALAFSTVNVNAFITFDGRYGEFKSNGGGAFIKFDPMQYICYMEEFKWYMDSDAIDLNAGESKATDASGVKLDGAQFISVHKDQDSLSFFSSKAKYDIKKKIIYAKDVKFMNVADAVIKPDTAGVTIDKKAKMRQLHNAQIVASYVTQNHSIYNATVDVFGRKKYSAKGYIDYVDEIEKNQSIYLREIEVDSTGQTYASGQVKEASSFKLSSNYGFYGDVDLFANNKYLLFKGYSRISHDCDLLSKNWFSFESEINPDQIYIPIDSTTKDLDGNLLTASLLLSKDSLGIYTSYLSQDQGYGNTSILPAQGFLFYDKKTEEYKISNKNKLQSMSFSGNYLSLNTKNCKVYGEGKINLGSNTGEVKINTVGVVDYNQLDDEAIFDMIMTTDFYFNDDALKEMTKDFQKASELDPAKLDRPVFEKGIRELVDKVEGDILVAQANLNGEFKQVPEILNKTMAFNDLKMRWNDESRSFRSFGKIGLSNIGDKQINKYVTGKVELSKKRTSDILTIYLEIDEDNWYFFTYSRGIMRTISANDDFNATITESKPEDRKLEIKGGKVKKFYQYMFSTERKKRDFLRKF